MEYPALPVKRREKTKFAKKDNGIAQLLYSIVYGPNLDWLREIIHWSSSPHPS